MVIGSVVLLACHCYSAHQPITHQLIRFGNKLIVKDRKVENVSSDCSAYIYTKLCCM